MKEPTACFLFGSIGVDNPTISSVFAQLFAADAKSVLLLRIHSDGGDDAVALSLVDAMDAARGRGAQIVTVGLSEVSSAALVVLAAGDYRLASSNLSALFHSGSSVFSHPVSHPELRAWQRHLDQQQDAFARVFSCHSGRSFGFWRKLLDSPKERWFTAQQLLKLGLIDEVL